MLSRADRRLPVLLLALALTGCGGEAPAAPDASSCANPAPVRYSRDPRDPSISVYFRPGFDPSATRGRLEGQLGFRIDFAFNGEHPGFFALLTDSQIATIRCDSAVSFLEWSVLGMAADKKIFR